VTPLPYMVRYAALIVGWLVAIATSAAAEQLSVVTTIFPLTEFARAVGGTDVQVHQLLPPGAESHTWDPKPSDIVKLSRADVFIFIGTAMEPWVPDVLRSLGAKQPELIEASKGLALITSQEGAADPHVWLDFEHDWTIVDKVVTAFSRRVPENAHVFARNGDEYKEKLHVLDLTYSSTLKACNTKEVVLGSHAAFGYLARRYGLTQVAVYGLSPNAEPTPKKMAEVIRVARSHHVRAIFFEELVSDNLASAIAQEVGAKTLVLNPGHNLTQRQLAEGVTFLSLMEKNLENLTNGLECN
jgi:zinc transport system substrate-binding protein